MGWTVAATTAVVTIVVKDPGRALGYYGVDFPVYFSSTPGFQDARGQCLCYPTSGDYYGRDAMERVAVDAATPWVVTIYGVGLFTVRLLVYDILGHAPWVTPISTYSKCFSMGDFSDFLTFS